MSKEDTQQTIGKLHNTPYERDAIHIAVAQVEAGTVLSAGMRVGFGDDGKVYRVAPEIIGIVDPFLTETVYVGDKFWLFLLPNTITSLKHLWTHPAFEAASPKLDKKAESEAWLRDFCATADCPGYDIVMQAITGELKNQSSDVPGYPDYYNCYVDGDYFFFGGRDAHGEIPAEFWHHVEVVTGKRQEKRPSYFSCSC